MTHTTTICGNCRHYERGNAWSGQCKADGHATSPGVPCPIGRFEPVASIAPEPVGTFRTALLASDVLAGHFGSDGKIAWKKTPPVPVEVLAIVGKWAMVRWTSEHAADREPFVVETVRLDMGEPKQ